MIVAVAFCPHPPALLPGLAQGAAAELAQVRAAALDAVRIVAADSRPVLVLGAGTAWEPFAPGSVGSMAGYGVDLRVTLGVPDDGAHDATHEMAGTPALPLSLTVGAWLVTEALGAGAPARGWSVGSGAVPSTLVDDMLAHAEPDCALLVMGDGSARRTPSAPGYLDERAARFDAQVAAALGSGDPAALSALDPAVGAQLLASGVPAWRAAAAVLDRCLPDGGRLAASVLADAAPFGVGYFVATWLPLDRFRP